MDSLGEKHSRWKEQKGQRPHAGGQEVGEGHEIREASWGPSASSAVMCFLQAPGRVFSRETVCSSRYHLTTPLSPGQSSMESGQRGPRKGRRLGSSRRRQMQEPADGQDAPMAPEPESLSSPVAAELQRFFQDCGAKERGFVTREDLAVSPSP